MLSKITAYVEKWQMFKKEDKIIVGVSGGADSICLLFVLLELQKTYGFRLLTVHVNHGLRGEAAASDEGYVRQICEEKHIPYIIYHENVELLAKNRKQSIEEAGRDVRRELFEKAMKEYNGTKIALAHHKNDNVETLFMNLARGTGLQGLGGMHPVNGVFVRPMLCVSRREIEEYLDKEGIVYCTDETNHSDAYTRNRIRNHIIPYIEKEINAKAVDHAEETMEYLREVQQFLEIETEKHFSDCAKEIDEGYLLLAKPFLSVPKVVKPLLVKQSMTRLAGRAKDLESVHFGAVLELFEKQVGRRVDLPYGLLAKRVYEGVEIIRKQPEDVKIFAKQVLEPEEFQKKVLWRNVTISYRIYEREEWEECVTQKSNTRVFDYDIISDILCVRTRKPGDYITLTPEGGTQKLKVFFINEKIEQSHRDNIPLIADGSHILWIVGHRINPAYKVTRNTKRILEIQIEEISL